jgi:hypothetical protein
MGLATFWAIFSRTHRVTLFANKGQHLLNSMTVNYHVA